VLSALNTVVSLGIFTLLFAAIYRVLPDTTIYWRHLPLGAFVTALLFTVGKSLIGWYLGQAAPNSTYGAAGALIVLMFWGLLLRADIPVRRRRADEGDR
jgi:membrane protein